MQLLLFALATRIYAIYDEDNGLTGEICVCIECIYILYYMNIFMRCKRVITSAGRTSGSHKLRRLNAVCHGNVGVCVCVYSSLSPQCIYIYPAEQSRGHAFEGNMQHTFWLPTISETENNDWLRWWPPDNDCESHMCVCIHYGCPKILSQNVFTITCCC